MATTPSHFELSVFETPTKREHRVEAKRTANGNLSFRIGPFSYILKPDGQIMRNHQYAFGRSKWENAIEFVVQGDWKAAFDEEPSAPKP